MNNQLVQIVLVIMGSLASLGLLAGGVGYLYSQFVTGKGSRSKENIETENSLITFLKNQNEGFEKIVKEQNVKIVDLGKEMAAMKATNEEKDKTIEKYLSILQNRNPELEQFMQKMTVLGENSEAFMKGQIVIMGEIQTFMQAINTHMETANKDLKIEATVSHNGTKKTS